MAEAIVLQDMDLLQSLLAPASLQIDRLFWLPAHRLFVHQFTNREALCPDFTDWKRLIYVPVSQCTDEVANPSIANKNQSSSTPQTSKTTKSAKSTVPNTCSRHINPSPQKEGRIRIARTATPFVACDVLAVAVASKRLELISLVLSKLNVQIYNCFHRIAPYRLCRGEEQLLARDEKGPLQMLNLEVMGNCSFWDKEFFRSKEFAKQLPALYALNICTRLPDGNTRAPVPEHVANLYHNEVRELERWFASLLYSASSTFSNGILYSTVPLYMAELMLSIGLDPNLLHITRGRTALGALTKVGDPEIAIRLLSMLLENGLMNFSLEVGKRQHWWTDSIILQWLIQFKKCSGPQFELVEQMIGRIISLGYGSSESQLDIDLNLSKVRSCVAQIENFRDDDENEEEESADGESDADSDDETVHNLFVNLHIQQPVEAIPGSDSKTVRKWLRECAQIRSQRKSVKKLVRSFDSGPLTLRELSRNALRRELRGPRFKERIDSVSQIAPFIKDYIIGRLY